MFDPPLPFGTLLDGRYRLAGLLGQGAMGHVYDAEDLRMSRRVAVKVLRGGSEDEARAAERLFREARAAARSDHPAVVTVHSYGVAAECALTYLVMERLSGETLASRIARLGPLPCAWVVGLARELLDALVAVHATAVVHRDLKPSNVFLASRGLRREEVKLLDFGVARLLDLQTLTMTGETYGTPVYMAPEQLRNPRGVDARSDLYSLGIVLYECLTGRPPFKATKLVPLTAEILLGPDLDVQRARPDCPDALAELVSRCAHVSVDQRFASAAVALSTLDQLGLG